MYTPSLYAYTVRLISLTSENRDDKHKAGAAETHRERDSWPDKKQPDTQYTHTDPHTLQEVVNNESLVAKIRHIYAPALSQ